MEPKGFYVVHKGLAFASEGNGQFAKDIVSVGRRIHPATDQVIEFDGKRLQALEYQNTRYLKNANSIPFPAGHTTDPLKNLGEWPGPFITRGDELVGVCNPKDPQALDKIKSGALDYVSAYIEKDVTDPKGNYYPEVMTHICATNYPVWTGQGNFIALAREHFKKSDVGVYLPEALDAGGACPDPMDLHATHKKLAGDLEASTRAYAAAHQANGAGHAVTKEAAGKMRDAATRLQNHAKLMAQHVQNQTTEYPYAMERPSLRQAVEELARTSRPDPDALAIALFELSDPKAFALAKGGVNPDGSFKGGFDGCVVTMQGRGYSKDSATRICGKINADKNS